jgi:calpain-15
VRPGVLGDEWFLSAAALLAERPALIERLFLTKEMNTAGIYKLRLCKNGEWVTVTVDDFIPCYPDGEPIFAKCHGNELWVMLLEKAYAKLHGNYYLLKGGFVHEALLDLTGCPCVSYDIEDEYVQHFVENGQFWELIKYFDDEGYLLSFSTKGEGRWVDNTLVKPEEDLDDDIAELPKGHAFSVVLVKEVMGNYLLNLRSPLQYYEWKGDWGYKSHKWTQKLKEAVGLAYIQQSQEENDGTFWISYQDVLKHFKTLNVCRIKNWDEVRIKGKFIRV